MDEAANVFAVEGAGTTVIHPMGAAMLAICGLLFAFLPRRYALWPLLVLTCFVSARQSVALFGLNLYFSRIAILFFGTARVFLKRDVHGTKLTACDIVVAAYGIWLLANAMFDPALLKFRAGQFVDVVGTYALFRLMIRDEHDLSLLVRCIAVVVVPLAGFFIFESSTGRNLFAIFGGIPEFTVKRGGHFRCQGAFGHPILAGVCCASLIPLLWWHLICFRKWRPLLATGLVASAVIVFLTASSTPVLGYCTFLAGVLLYPLRRWTRVGTTAFAGVLLVLHLVMESPVWSLIGRINITDGNSGYHRYLLIDGFINHIDEWWLAGSNVGTAHWGHFTFDTANQFVASGVNAGLLALLLFIGAVCCAFAAAGRISRTSPMLGWMIGVSVLVHVVCFFGISIWGQLDFFWSLTLAISQSMKVAPPGIQSASSQLSRQVSEQRRFVVFALQSCRPAC